MKWPPHKDKVVDRITVGVVLRNEFPGIAGNDSNSDLAIIARSTVWYGTLTASDNIVVATLSSDRKVVYVNYGDWQTCIGVSFSPSADIQDLILTAGNPEPDIWLEHLSGIGLDDSPSRFAVEVTLASLGLKRYETQPESPG